MQRFLYFLDDDQSSLNHVFVVVVAAISTFIIEKLRKHHFFDQLVISKLDYCNVLYIKIKKTLLNKLKSILNGAIRFIYNISDRSICLVQYYKKAHILPIEQRITYKICLLTHKAVHGKSPEYIKELVEIEAITNTQTCTRSKTPGDWYRLRIPKIPKNKFDERRFSSYAPTAWNSLPLALRSLNNTDSFKGLLKHYLYDSF